MRHFNNGTGLIDRYVGGQETRELHGGSRWRRRSAESRRAQSSPFRLEVLEDRIELSTIQVNTLADNPNGPIPNSTTLRDAINRADSGSDTQYTIDLTGLSGTITLSTALPDLSTNISIAGPGANALSVAGGSGFRVFNVSPDAMVEISGLTIRGGHPSFTYLVMHGGNGYSGGRGGGISNAGTMQLVDSSISDSQAHEGGGIYNSGSLAVVRCAIAANSASTDSVTYGPFYYPNMGPFYFPGVGAGIFNSGSCTVLNSTISGNSASGDGGGIDSTGRLEVLDSTMDGNSADGKGGGIAVVGSANPTFASANSIYHNPSGGNLALDSSSTFTSEGHNLFSDAPEGILDPTDLINTDPLLGPLADNGGPTQTMALLAGSPAINAGSNALAVDPSSGQPLTTDQRGAGFGRYGDGTVDIGFIRK